MDIVFQPLEQDAVIVQMRIIAVDDDEETLFPVPGLAGFPFGSRVLPWTNLLSVSRTLAAAFFASGRSVLPEAAIFNAFVPFGAQIGNLILYRIASIRNTNVTEMQIMAAKTSFPVACITAR